MNLQFDVIILCRNAKAFETLAAIVQVQRVEGIGLLAAIARASRPRRAVEACRVIRAADGPVLCFQTRQDIVNLLHFCYGFGN